MPFQGRDNRNKPTLAPHPWVEAVAPRVEAHHKQEEDRRGQPGEVRVVGTLDVHPVGRVPRQQRAEEEGHKEQEDEDGQADECSAMLPQPDPGVLPKAYRWTGDPLTLQTRDIGGLEVFWCRPRRRA